MLLQQMTSKTVILRDIDFMENSVGFGAATMGDASTIYLYLMPRGEILEFVVGTWLLEADTGQK